MLRMLPKKILPWQLWLALVLIPLFWITISSLGWLQSLETITLNWRFKIRGDIHSPAKLVYVDIDSDAIDLMGEHPIPRAFFAEAVQALFDEGHAKTIGINILFSQDNHSTLVDEAKVSHDSQIMHDVIKSYPNLVLAGAYAIDEELSVARGLKFTAKFPYSYLGFEEGCCAPELPDLTIIGSSPVNIGLINLAEHCSPGSVPRWVPMFAKSPDATYLTIALEMARIYFDVPKENVQIFEDEIILINQQRKAIVSVPLSRNQLVEVNWFSRWLSPENTHVSLKEVLDHYQAIKSENSAQKAQAATFFQQFDSAAILIGAVDPFLQDLAKTPFGGSSVPRVGVHGNLFKTIVSDAYLLRFPAWVNYLILFSLTAVMVFMGIFPSRWGGWLKIGSAVVLLVYLFLTYVFFKNFNWVLPVIAPVYASVTTTFVGVIYQLVKTEKQRTHIQQLFGTYVSPELVNQIVQKGEDPQLGGAEETISALFSDVEGFTSIAESLSPNQVVDLMNEYLSAMTHVIQEERGTLDKYIGDAVVAMFGAPLSMEDHALAACRCCCRMHQKQLELCEKWKSEGNKWPELVKAMRTRIGINTGPAIIGNMGSSTRFNYTMMGDNVNLAARCESASSSYSVYTMTTGSTRASVESLSDEILFRNLDRLVVKGKSHPIDVHQVVAFKEGLLPQAYECVELYENALKYYFKQDWDNAIKTFALSAELESYLPHYQGDEQSPSQVFKLRCQILKNHPVREAWDGVFVMDHK